MWICVNRTTLLLALNSIFNGLVVIQAVDDIKAVRLSINQEKIFWNFNCQGNNLAIKQML